MTWSLPGSIFGVDEHTEAPLERLFTQLPGWQHCLHRPGRAATAAAGSKPPSHCPFPPWPRPSWLPPIPTLSRSPSSHQPPSSTRQQPIPPYQRRCHLGWSSDDNTDEPLACGGGGEICRPAGAVAGVAWALATGAAAGTAAGVAAGALACPLAVTGRLDRATPSGNRWLNSPAPSLQPTKSATAQYYMWPRSFGGLRALTRRP